MGFRLICTFELTKLLIVVSDGPHKRVFHEQFTNSSDGPILLIVNLDFGRGLFEETAYCTLHAVGRRADEWSVCLSHNGRLNRPKLKTVAAIYQTATESDARRTTIQYTMGLMID
jgi:hypothetical protein